MRVSKWHEVQTVLAEMRLMQHEILRMQEKVADQQERVAYLILEIEREENSSNGATSSPSGSSDGASFATSSSRRSVQPGDAVEVKTRGEYRGQRAVVLSRRGVLFWNIRLDTGEVTYRMRRNVRLI